MKTKPIKDKTYLIRHFDKREPEWCAYSGKGVYTGKTEFIGETCYEFKLPVGSGCGVFPLSSIFSKE